MLMDNDASKNFLDEDGTLENKTSSSSSTLELQRLLETQAPM
jgi:hypothetical protein